MSDQQQSIAALIEAVMAGGEYIERDVQRAFGGYRDSVNRSLVAKAYYGSPDAALSLQEALLPDTLWKITPLGAVRIVDTEFLLAYASQIPDRGSQEGAAE